MLPGPFCLQRCSNPLVLLHLDIELEVLKVLDKLLYLGWKREMAELRAGMGTGVTGGPVGSFRWQMSPVKLSSRKSHLPCWICTTRTDFCG